MSRLPKKANEEEPDAIDENKSTVDIKNTEDPYDELFKVLSYDAVLMLTEVEMTEARCQNLYGQNLQKMVDLEPIWILSDVNIHCKKSFVDGSF